MFHCGTSEINLIPKRIVSIVMHYYSKSIKLEVPPSKFYFVIQLFVITFITFLWRTEFNGWKNISDHLKCDGKSCQLLYTDSKGGQNQRMTKYQSAAVCLFLCYQQSASEIIKERSGRKQLNTFLEEKSPCAL